MDLMDRSVPDGPLGDCDEKLRGDTEEEKEKVVAYLSGSIRMYEGDACT